MSAVCAKKSRVKCVSVCMAVCAKKSRVKCVCLCVYMCVYTCVYMCVCICVCEDSYHVLHEICKHLSYCRQTELHFVVNRE